MKGIILAGGAGTRMYPLTLVTSKQLLPVYNKPMVYYPLSTLMQAGIRDILLISKPEDLPSFQKLLLDGSQFGVHITYAEQEHPDGLAQAFLIGEDFIGGDTCAMVLGDNIFYGSGFEGLLAEAVSDVERGYASIFAYSVPNPQRFGVVELGADGSILSIVEKPSRPASSYAVTGLYFYDNRVIDIARTIERSPRGEYEITDVSRRYLELGALRVRLMGRGYMWLDAGSFINLSAASTFVQLMQERQGIEICSPEEIAYSKGWITQQKLLESASRYSASPYGRRLRMVAEGKGGLM